MYQFQAQTTKLLKSSSDYQKYYATNLYTTSGYGMPNCTCYALGRVNTLQALNGLSINNFAGFHGNGADWGESGMIGNGWTHSSKPKLGAVACFRDRAGEGGHVAIVEKIYDNGNVDLSNSGWAGRENLGNENASTWWYFNSNVSMSDYRSGTFKYYLYPPFIDDEPDPDPPKPPDPPDPPSPTPIRNKGKSWIPLGICNALKRSM